MKAKVHLEAMLLLTLCLIIYLTLLLFQNRDIQVFDNYKCFSWGTVCKGNPWALTPYNLFFFFLFFFFFF